MPLTLRLIPGYQFFETEKLDTNKLNQLGRPTIELLGSITSAIISPGSVTSDKLSPSLISTLPPKPDPLNGNDLLMIEDISVTALKKITISQVLSAGVKDLPKTTAVKLLEDYAFVIQGGINKQATIENLLQEAISKQTEITTAGGIDPVADMVWLWDANATAGTNPNRKARIGNFVASFTNTLIAHSLPFPPATNPTEKLDMLTDEVLVNNASATAPDQQFRVKLSELVAVAGGTKAWANIKTTEVIDKIVITTWDPAGSVVDTAGFAGTLHTGDWIWYLPADAANSGVAEFTPYYIRLLQGQSTQFRMFNTKAAALADDTAQLVSFTANASTGRVLLHWHANPIRAGFNISSIISTQVDFNNHRGYFRVSFENPLVSANYVVQLTGSHYQGNAKTTGSVCAINVQGADAEPSVTRNPETTNFDVICRTNFNAGEATPDYLMIAVFA